MIKYRHALRGDIDEILSLMREFASEEDLEDLFEITAGCLAEVMFGEDAFVKGVVAVGSGEIVAYAFYFDHFSSFRGQKGVYLEDIFVERGHRGSGIGRELLRRIADEAAARGAVRMDFEVLTCNGEAKDFYRKLGGNFDETVRRCRIVDAAFGELPHPGRGR